MKKIFDPDALSEFARCYGFHYDHIDSAALVEDALAEMERGLAGQTSSMAMIPAYISPAAETTPGKTVVALDAGGTNLRAALVSFDESGRAFAAETLKANMPGTSGRISADAFFDQIAALAAPLIEKSGGAAQRMGFCFSYPMEITKDADGILTAFSKEVDAPDVIGKSIGGSLRDALVRRNAPVPERIVMLNDTAATLLAGGGGPGGVQGAPLIGFILGTGINIAYTEKRIPKIGFDLPAYPQIVVCETGNFAHRYTGLLDSEFDSTTKNPGAYTLEKTIAGAYLGPLTFHIIKRALRDGLFSFDRQDEFLALPALHTKDLNAFLCEASSPVAELFGAGEQDAAASFMYLSSIITRRGATLAAAMLAAAVEKTGGGESQLSPVRIAVEGTTYLVYKGMRNAIESRLHLLLNRHRPRSYRITAVEQASLLGAAAAAFS